MVKPGDEVRSCALHGVKRFGMEDFKVSLESLHTAKIKEINYEGEETYQE